MTANNSSRHARLERTSVWGLAPTSSKKRCALVALLGATTGGVQ
jgi:hypothetical protein